MGMCGGDYPDPNPVTEIEREQARAAVKNYNEYIKDKPTINAYLRDISTDPTISARTVQGQAGADLAQKAVFTPVNPNLSMTANGMARGATLRTKVMNDLGQDSVSQQAAAKRTFVDNAMGLQTTVDTAQQGLARDAVSRNIADSEAAYSSKAATMGGMASLAGDGSAIAKDFYKPKEK